MVSDFQSDVCYAPGLPYRLAQKVPPFEYTQYLLEPFSWHSQTFEVVGPDTHKLNWILSGGPTFSYTCYTALALNAKREECTTPAFDFRDGVIPGSVIDYMERFAKIFQVGAAWGRAWSRSTQEPVPLSSTGTL